MRESSNFLFGEICYESYFYQNGKNAGFEVFIVDIRTCLAHKEACNFPLMGFCVCGRFYLGQIATIIIGAKKYRGVKRGRIWLKITGKAIFGGRL
jgi:hypothetical protein